MFNIRKFGLKAKLASAFGLLAFFIIVISAISFTSLERVTKTYQHILEINTPKERLLTEFRMNQKDIVISVRSVVGASGESNVIDENLKNLTDISTRFVSSAEKFEQLPFSEGEKEIWDQIKNDVKPLLATARQIITLSRSAAISDLNKRDLLVKNEFDTQRKKLRTEVEAMKDFIAADSNKWDASAEQTSKNAKWVIVGSSLFGCLFGIIAAIFITLNLHGLLTAITKKLAVGANEVSGAAKNISESSEQLSSTVSRGAAAAQETSAAIEEISSMVAKTSGNATSSQELVSSSETTVAEGKEQIQRMLNAIQQIDKSNSQISAELVQSDREFSEIINVITEISAKTQVINDIVFQTKLLSFNASVEAARAGEHGKGFSVVAEEVGNLAAMSGAAAKEITAMLDASTARVEGIVKNSSARMQEIVKSSAEKVTSGKEIVNKCDAVFQDIVSKMDQIKGLTDEISRATNEQSIGANDVSKSIAELDRLSQGNSSVAQRSAVLAQQLGAQASGLSSVVSELVNAVEGASAQTRVYVDGAAHAHSAPGSLPRNISKAA